MEGFAAAAILSKRFAWEREPSWPDAHMPTDSELRVAGVLPALLRFCAQISCARSSSLAARQSRSWIDLTSMFREIGFHVPDDEESRQSQIQRTTATISATQLTAMGIECVPTVTCA